VIFMVKRSRLSSKIVKPIYRNLRFGRTKKVLGIPTRDISGEEQGRYYGGFNKFSGTEFLMKIHYALENPSAFKKIWGMVKAKYGLSEFDWSFIRDEEDPALLRKYLVIADEATGGKYPWMKGGK